MPEHPKPKLIHVIANPASTRREPILKTLNDHFHRAGIAWQISVTAKTGDGASLAREAIARGADLIAVFGGDGTVKDVAEALIKTDTPLLIFPAGTGNVVAASLGRTGGLGAIARAARLVCGEAYQTKSVDVGKMGNRFFLLRSGLRF